MLGPGMGFRENLLVPHAKDFPAFACRHQSSKAHKGWVASGLRRVHGVQERRHGSRLSLLRCVYVYYQLAPH